jgi:thioredoxin-like negative regulator of GroEL
VILFTTSACQFCGPVKEALNELKEKYADDMLLKIWTVDKQPAGMAVAREWMIGGVPTTLLILDKQEIGKKVGAATKEELDEFIQGSIQSYLLQKSPGGSDDISSTLLCDSSESTDTREGSNQDRHREGVEL